MKKKHNRPQKRLITQLSLWLALLLAFTGCAESTVTSQDNTYAIAQLDDPLRMAGSIGDCSIGTRIRTVTGKRFRYTRIAAGHICNRRSDRRGHISIFPPGDSGILRHTLYRGQWQPALFHRGGADHTVLRNLQRAGQPGALWRGICQRGTGSDADRTERGDRSREAYRMASGEIR